MLARPMMTTIVTMMYREIGVAEARLVMIADACVLALR